MKLFKRSKMPGEYEVSFGDLWIEFNEHRGVKNQRRFAQILAVDTATVSRFLKGSASPVSAKNMTDRIYELFRIKVTDLPEEYEE